MKILEISWTSSKKRGRCLDFFISGHSLLKELERRGYDYVPRLGSDWLPLDGGFRRLLLLESSGDLPNDRVALYVCPECGDFGCGVVSTKIEQQGDEILWTAFGTENGDEPRVRPIEKLGPYHFNAAQYREALTHPMITHR